MGDIRAQTLEAQKNAEPARQPDREPVPRHEPGALQLVAPQAAYRRAQVNRNELTPADLLALQRTVGNHRVHRILARRTGDANDQQQRESAQENPAFKVQTSVATGVSNEIYLHEADAVTGRMMQWEESALARKSLRHGVTHAAQHGGGAALVQRQIFTSTIKFRKRLFSRQFQVDPGKSLTASINARRSPQGCQMPANFVAYLYNVATKTYEATVQFPTDASSQYTWKGLKRGAYQLILVLTEDVAEGCTLAGTLEVRQEGAVNRIVPTARSHVGSAAWAVDTNRPPYGSGTNKCNLFVYEVLNEAGAAVQMIERRRFGISRGKHPPLAGQWADSGFGIAGWTVVSTPEPGDVVAEAHEYSDASGHVGIVSSVSPDGTGGTTISAATSGAVVENDWGFRSGQKVVFRRYAGR